MSDAQVGNSWTKCFGTELVLDLVGVRTLRSIGLAGKKNRRRRDITNIYNCDRDYNRYEYNMNLKTTLSSPFFTLFTRKF